MKVEMTYNDAEEATHNALSSVLPTRRTVNQTVLSLVIVSPVASLLDLDLGLDVSSISSSHRQASDIRRDTGSWSRHPLYRSQDREHRSKSRDRPCRIADLWTDRRRYQSSFHKTDHGCILVDCRPSKVDPPRRTC